MVDEHSEEQGLPFEAADEEGDSLQKPPLIEEVTKDDVVVRTFFPDEKDEAEQPGIESAQSIDSAGEPASSKEAVIGTSIGTPLPEPPGEVDLDSTQPQSPTRPQKTGVETRSHPHPDMTSEEPEGKKGCRISCLGMVLLALALVSFVLAGGILAWNQLGQPELPVVSDLLTQIPLERLPGQGASATETPASGVLLEPTQRSSLTDTPSIGVTEIPVTPSEEGTEPTPTRDTSSSHATPESTEEPPTTAASPTGEDIEQNGVEMVYVPGGTFIMGSGVSGANNPAHEVTLDAYYIDKTEVTNAQWAACVEDGGCALPTSTGDYNGDLYYDDDTFSGYPVIFVSWYAAGQYCQWRGARLPTEAEWEMAAGWDPETGEATIYPWGDEWDGARLNSCDAGCLLSAYANPGVDDGWPQLAPVGSFPAGGAPLGALDMVGNVAEWVGDWFAPGYYLASPEKNPTGPSSGILRVARGGSWGVGQASLLTVTVRSRFAPETESAGLGFRCAVSASQIEQD